VEVGLVLERLMVDSAVHAIQCHAVWYQASQGSGSAVEIWSRFCRWRLV